MYSNEEIARFVDIIAEVSDPDKIILFGSYAYGQPTDKSDLDLLIIKNGRDFSIDDEVELKLAIFKKRMQSGIRIPYDLFIQTEKQARECAVNGGSFVDALQKGKVVYERTNKEKIRIVL